MPTPPDDLLAMEVEEGHILADLSILEFYLHRSIQLRLGAFGKTDDDDSRSELKQASLQTVIVSGTTKGFMDNCLTSDVLHRYDKDADECAWWVA